MPDTISHEPWHLLGPGVDIWFDAPGDIIWLRNYRGRNTLPLCGDNTITIRDLGKRNIKLAVQINPGAMRNTRKETFIALAEQNVQFALIPPGSGPVTCKFDPGVAFEERWQNGRRLLTMGFQEVGTPIDVGAPPPALPPFTLWANPIDLVFTTENTVIPVTISWGGHIHYPIPSAIWITNLAHNTFYESFYGAVTIPKTIVGTAYFIVTTHTDDVPGGTAPPNGTYQWTLRPIDGVSFEPAYSTSFTVTRP